MDKINDLYDPGLGSSERALLVTSRISHFDKMITIIIRGNISLCLIAKLDIPSAP